jgi:hypothetical protein
MAADGGAAAVVWVGSDEVWLVPAATDVDCACESLGSSFGTGRKNCPNAVCNKDQLCVCAEKCEPVLDPCPPPGSYLYLVEDREGVQVAEAPMTVADWLPQCSPPVQPVENEEAGGDSSGCRASASQAPGAAGLLLLAVLLVLGFSALRAPAAGGEGKARGPAPTGGALLAASALIFFSACAKDEARRDKAGEKSAPTPPAPEELSLEGSPWEPVVAAQAEFLDLFETGDGRPQILQKARRWGKRHQPKFAEDCATALKDYADQPARRLPQMTKAGQAWGVVQSRIEKLTADWPARERREVGILINEFRCR